MRQLYVDLVTSELDYIKRTVDKWEQVVKDENTTPERLKEVREELVERIESILNVIVMAERELD